MSYDVWLEIDTGAGESLRHDVGNMTSNVSPMWAIALEAAGFPSKEADHRPLLRDLEGMRAVEAVPYLQKALAHMRDPANLTTYEALTPSNGWGSYQGAVMFLQQIHDACAQHPKTVIRIWA